ncbi:hypothetical protein GCM10007872_30750 [Gluconobacter sphaericus NBRC 12467]|uniref:Uncharacterized protein n=1 Tax=Gluconobacter sphaericus NBRC 12467 TaxID=1307951 RepID=A0AA37SJL0_9PROT|nr:hypothetical protein GSP01_20340 [Gluconobacter sphaericus NBRC 12467]GLQ86164.1 hypothetical protein GCM10007872_30750 [Gluconobacter sphaericus NBRC 12467]
MVRWRVKQESHVYSSFTAPDRDEADLFRLVGVLVGASGEPVVDLALGRLNGFFAG